MLTKEQLASVRLVAFDFDGVFTDNAVWVSQDGIESVRCWRSDGLGIQRLRAVGVDSFIISTETNPVVTTRAAKLKMECHQAVEDKARCLLDLCRRRAVDPAQTMFVGNDINDIPAFQSVGLAVAVADAYPEVRQHVIHWLERAGGKGAVREICDLIFEARGGGDPI